MRQGAKSRKISKSLLGEEKGHWDTAIKRTRKLSVLYGIAKMTQTHCLSLM